MVVEISLWKKNKRTNKMRKRNESRIKSFLLRKKYKHFKSTLTLDIIKTKWFRIFSNFRLIWKKMKIHFSYKFIPFVHTKFIKSCYFDISFFWLISCFSEVVNINEKNFGKNYTLKKTNSFVLHFLVDKTWNYSK